MTVSRSTLDVIGNTPIVQLRRLVADDAATVLVKLEYLNPTGSYKDRMAKAIVEGAEARGDLRPGMTVVELTGGSTGSSLAFVCATNAATRSRSSRRTPSRRREAAAPWQAFGAELIIEPSVGGQITADLIQRRTARARGIERDEGAYWTDQFHNDDALTGYRGIADELGEQVPGTIDAFVGGVGTGGMLAGVLARAPGAGQPVPGSSGSSRPARQSSPRVAPAPTTSRVSGSASRRRS